MNIEVKENKKEFYKELINVTLNYKKIIKNPDIEVTDFIKKNNVAFIIYLILFIIVLYFRITSKDSYFNFFIYLVGFFMFLDLFLIIQIEIKLKKYLKSKKECKVDINKNGFTLFRDKDFSFNMEWHSVRMVVIGHYGIMFVSKDSSGLIIDIPIKYLDDVKENLSKNIKIKYL